MHILYFQPGSGGSFYCQNCLRDISICDALRAAGHAVTMLPLYLPATADSPAPDDIPIFYSAVTLYLRHKYSWMRRLPRSWFRPLDSWPVLKFAARFAGTTSAEGLEDLTLSMLRGMEGRQAEELALLAEWVESLPAGEQPDLIILSNALLLGLAQRLKAAADCPVLCWLQDEHLWTDPMHASLKQSVLKTMRADTRHVDQFVAVSHYYRDFMSALLGIDKSAIAVINPGLAVDQYIKADVTSLPRRIGFLSRLSSDDGFETFVDSFIELRKNTTFRDVQISATGGASPDRKFMARQLRKLRDAGLSDDARICNKRFREDRHAFLSELTLLSVPGGAHPEAFGYYAIEAMAAGVPVVLPDHGAFPEFVNFESGGILLNSRDPVAVAGVWAELLASPAKLQTLSVNARLHAQRAFDQSTIADKITACGARGRAPSRMDDTRVPTVR